MVKRELIIVTRILDDHGGFSRGSIVVVVVSSRHGQGRIVILHDHAASTSAVATTRKQFTIFIPHCTHSHSLTYSSRNDLRPWWGQVRYGLGSVVCYIFRRHN